MYVFRLSRLRLSPDNSLLRMLVSRAEVTGSAAHVSLTSIVTFKIAMRASEEDMSSDFDRYMNLDWHA